MCCPETFRAKNLFAGGPAMSFALFDKRGWQTMISETLGKGSPKLPPLKKGSSTAIEQPWFEAFIQNFIKTDPANALEQKFAGEPIYKAALIGFVKGSDPLYEQYKKIIGPFHHTPAEVMAWAANEQGVKAPDAGQIGVVSFILPLNDPIVKDNAAAKDWGSARWGQARLFGEMFMRKLMLAMLVELSNAGLLAAAGDFMPDFRKKQYPVVSWASPWSHRHTAFAAGLGSFGMHDALITEAGDAHRCGSIVVAMPLKPNREQLPHYRHNCKQHRQGNCLVCAKRCPVNAISEKGHDKVVCSKLVMKSIPRNIFVNNVAIYSCGLCMTGTPCAQKIPV
jgi:epoxyqueuosine reductase